MSNSWKLILTCYHLLLLAISVLIVAVVLGYSEPLAWLQLAFANSDNRMAVGLVGVILGIIGIGGLISSLRGDRVSSMVVQETVEGQVIITVPAIKQMILKAVKEVEGVKEVKPMVHRGKSGGAIIDLVLMVNPDYKVPEMTSSIQAKVRKFLQEVGGLSVEEIKVTVDDFASKPGVR